MRALVLGLVLLAAPAAAFAQDASPRVGDRAPDFTLWYATRDSVAHDSLTLSRLVGSDNIVLAFYPADWSGGCTKEVCTLRDNFSSLGALHADVIGISGDYVFTHHEWANHHNLPFRLASDHDHAVARRYDSFNPATGFNRRTVFVVDKTGKIAYVDLHYSPVDAKSFNQLQDALKKL